MPDGAVISHCSVSSLETLLYFSRVGEEQPVLCATHHDERNRRDPPNRDQVAGLRKVPMARAIVTVILLALIGTAACSGR